MSKMLKPCPFCGNAAFAIEESPYCDGSLAGPHLNWCVECSHCEASSGWYRERDEAEQAWEKRTYE